MRYLALLAIPLVASACFTEPKRCAAVDPSDPATEVFAPSLNIDLSTWTKTPNGVYEQDEVVGQGQALTVLTKVDVFYVAYLRNGTVVDQQLQQPFPMDMRTITAFGVIDGMMGMNVGGRRRLVVPSQLALGACGAGSIPPNSTLVYEIELLDIASQ